MCRLYIIQNLLRKHQFSVRAIAIAASDGGLVIACPAQTWLATACGGPGVVWGLGDVCARECKGMCRSLIVSLTMMTTPKRGCGVCVIDPATQSCVFCVDVEIQLRSRRNSKKRKRSTEATTSARWWLILICKWSLDNKFKYWQIYISSTKRNWFTWFLFV